MDRCHSALVQLDPSNLCLDDEFRRSAENGKPNCAGSSIVFTKPTKCFDQHRVIDMKTVTSKLFPLAGAVLLAGLCSPVSAQYNMNTTIQEGRINTNDTYQRGRVNDNATYQEGRDNANRTRQRGANNWNQTGQFGRANYNETDQRGRFKRTGAKKKR